MDSTNLIKPECEKTSVESNLIPAHATLNNRFEIRAGNRVYTANNSFFGIGDCLANKKPYASYIIVGTSQGDIALKTECTHCNTDVLNGLVTATYVAIMPEGEDENIQISSFYLSPDGVSVVNAAQIAPFTKGADPVAISATVYLQFDENNGAVLIGGKNEFAYALLGARAIGSFTAKGGSNRFENAPIDIDFSYPTVQECEANVTCEDGKLVITTDLPYSSHEAIIFMDGEAVLRANICKLQSANYNLSGIANDERYLSGTGTTINWVTSMSLQGSPIAGSEIYHIPKQLVKIRRPVMFEYSQDMMVLTDPMGRSAVFASEDEYYVLNTDGSQIVLMGHGARDGKKIFMPYENVVCLYDGAKVYKYDFNYDAAEFLKTWSVAADINKSVVGCEAGIYYIVDVFSSYSRRRLLNDSGTVSAANMVSVGASGGDAFRNNFSVAVISSKNVACSAPSAQDTKFVEKFKAIMERVPTLTVNTLLDGVVHISDSSTGINEIVCVMSGEVESLSSTGTFKTSGQFMLTKDNGTTKVFFYNKETMSLLRLSFDDVNSVQNVAKIGNFLIVFRNSGVLEQYYINSEKSGVVNPLCVSGNSYSYILNSYKLLIGSNQSAHVRICIG